MNLEQLQRKLLAAARANPPGDHVPYAFEKRILARLASVKPMDSWALWSHALWRAAAPCVAMALLLGVFHVVAPEAGSVDSGAVTGATNYDLPQDFAQTLLAAVNETEEVW